MFFFCLNELEVMSWLGFFNSEGIILSNKGFKFFETGYYQPKQGEAVKTPQWGLI